MSAPVAEVTHSATATGLSPWEGRLFGGIVLAAFVLYGIGSTIADQPLGLAMVVVNSITVSLAGLIGFRLARTSDHTVALGYVLARVAEAVLLLGGILLAQHADVSDADNTGYLLAMMALAVGSIPFCQTLGRRRWLPPWFATWGMYGYAALAVGASLELATGRSLTVIFAVPGGLFELVLGARLVWRGFDLD